jgi:hypothetical protein
MSVLKTQVFILQTAELGLGFKVATFALPLTCPKQKGLPVEFRKPLKTNNKLVAGVRFDLTTFGL